MTDNFRSHRAGGRSTDPSQVETSQESLDRLRREIAGLRASRERLAVAVDSDRRSIERELHDGLQQRLVALAVNLQLARNLLEDDRTAANALLYEMGGEVQRALDATASLAQRIYPPLLETGGLGAALRAAAVSLGVRARIEVTGASPCPPEIAGTAYFCCLGVLERAGSEAPATIDVRFTEEELTFDVSAGDPVAGGSPDLLADRIEALGGRLAIVSEPGHGIRVSGSLPVSR